jgi:hypothetical protein
VEGKGIGVESQMEVGGGGYSGVGDLNTLDGQVSGMHRCVYEMQIR